MNLKSLSCPNCGACLEVDDGLDIFFCKYCGHKIMLQGQSKAAYDAKVRVKHMEHKERLQEKRDAQDRYRMEFKQKDERRTLAIVFGIFGAIIAMCLIISAVGNAGAKKQEQELQAIVDQILIDIENEKSDEKIAPITSAKAGRIITEIGFQKVAKTINKMVSESVKTKENSKNVKATKNPAV